VVALDPALGGLADVIDEVGLEADDRLDPGGRTGLVVLDGAVHHPVIGEPQGRHPQLGRPIGERVADHLAVRVAALELARAVEQGVLAVDVKMDRTRALTAHRAIFASGPDDTGGRIRNLRGSEHALAAASRRGRSLGVR
jgi:hypothetical protein